MAKKKEQAEKAPKVTSTRNPAAPKARKGIDKIAATAVKLNQVLAAAAPVAAPEPKISRRKEPNPAALAQAGSVKAAIEARLLEVEALIASAFPEKARSPRWALKRLDEFRKDVARHLDKAAAVQ